MSNRKVAIIGSGNIGTDLMIKILRHGQHLEMAVMVGIDPQSDGLARARRMGVATTHEGVIGLMNMPEFADIDIVFDATSAGAHVKNDAALRGERRSTERQHGHLRRPGHHSNGGGSFTRGACSLRRNYRFYRQ